MTRCPSIEDLEAALSNGELLPDLKRHVAECRRCRARVGMIEEHARFVKSVRTDAHSLKAAMQATTHAARVIPNIHGFEIIRELHRGGQGIVYLARQSATKRLVAIKLLLSAALATSRQRRRFEREIEIAAGLRHPRIVTVFESGVTADGWHWFAMEHVEGVPLDAYLGKHRPPLQDILQLLAEVCDAVNYAHQRGIIHRDLKPANILIDADGHPHILDFGLAKVTGSAAPDAELFTTRTGEFMGTFAYAAPEQFRAASADIDTRTDVYALGIMLFEAVTGTHPFPAAGSLPDYIKAVEHRAPPRLSQISTPVSAELEAVMLRALATEPGRRYQSAGALGDDLKRCRTGEPVEARRDSRWYLLRKAAHRHRIAALVAVAFAVLILGFAGLTIRQARRIAVERDRAISAEAESSQTARSLAAALRESDIERARLLTRSGNVTLAEEMLRAELPAPTPHDSLSTQLPDDDAYWALWELYAASPCQGRIQLDGGSFAKAAINEARDVLAVATDRTVRLYHLPDLAMLQTLEPGPAEISSVRFVPDTQQIATSDARGEIALRDPATGKIIRTLQCGDERIRGISLLPDGRTVIVNTHDRRILQMNLDGASSPLTGPGDDSVYCIDVAKTGRRVAFAGAKDTATVIDLDNPEGAVTLPTPGGPRKGVVAVRFAPDGRRLALGREDGSTEIWDLDHRRRTWGGRIHRAATITLAFSTDGRILASGGYDRTIRLIATDDGRVIHTLAGHSGSISALHFFADNSRLVSVDILGSLRVWDTDEEPGIRKLPGGGKTLFGVAFSPDGTRLAVTGDAPTQVIDLRTGSPLHRLGGHRGIVTSAAFSPDASLLATSGYDFDIRLWDLASGAERAVLKGHDNYVEGVAFCMDGRRLASAGDDAVVRLWDVDTHECLAVMRGHEGRCPMLAVSPDGRMLATCSTDMTVRLWSAEDGAPRGVLTGHRLFVRAVAFSPDGRYVISGSDDATIRIWDAATRECVGSMTGSDEDIFGLSVSPDGRFAATAMRGGGVQLWSLARQRPLARVARSLLPMFNVRFSPDGRTLAACGEDGEVRLIDLGYFGEHIRAAGE